MMRPMHPVQRAIQHIGSQTLLAQMVDVRQPTVSEWVRGERPVPPERCTDIERATAGDVACEELRPDIHWHRIKDATWPHPKGRPLIEVARQG